MKYYYLWPQIGRVRYPLAYHDGKETHKDGSPFWGMECISNKKKLRRRVMELIAQGYAEGKP